MDDVSLRNQLNELGQTARQYLNYWKLRAYKLCHVSSGSTWSQAFFHFYDANSSDKASYSLILVWVRAVYDNVHFYLIADQDVRIKSSEQTLKIVL